MTRYCTTSTKKDGRRVYGIDLVEYADEKFTVLMSRPNITHNREVARRVAEYANYIQVPPNLFDEFLRTVLKK